VNRSEIETCVAQAKSGNREELLKIIEQYRPFIVKTTKTYRIRNYDFYDLMQIGYVALINAVSKYRTGSNSFSTYAYIAIENAYKYTARQNNRYDSEISLFSPICTTENKVLEYIDYIEALQNLEEDFLYSEKTAEIRRAISKLSPDEVELVIMVYYSKCTLYAYAEKKGISYSSALRRKKKVLEKLGMELKNKLH
jgi:RNA polymerase sporulation-specific sigma factor